MNRILILLLFAFLITSCGDGKIKKVRLENDEQVLEYYANGSPRIVRVVKMKDGKYDFEYEKEYYEDGNLLKEGPIVNNKRDGRWKSYYRDGTLWSEGDYANGEREGLTKSYFPNGALRYEGNFTKGVKSGQWNFYNENGTFEKMATFMAPGEKDTITLQLPSQDTQEGDH
jgi:antitoxin component YwqK of YwqJK toxin-antitoxin module